MDLNVCLHRAAQQLREGGIAGLSAAADALLDYCEARSRGASAPPRGDERAAEMDAMISAARRGATEPDITEG